MKIKIVVFKDSGKYYTSEIVENNEDILMFKDEFKKFIKDNIPANLHSGYIMVEDANDYNNQSFHIALYKYNEIF